MRACRFLVPAVLLACQGIAFAAMAEPPPAAPAPASPASATAPAITALPGGGSAGTTATAAVAPPADKAPPYAAGLRARTRTILAGPDFHGHDTVRYPVPREWLREWLKRDKPRTLPKPPPDLALWGRIFQYVALAALALGLAWLLWRGWQWLAPQVAGRAPGRGGVPPEIRHLALPDSPLPEAIGAAAQSAWGAGDPAQALSLLYRGAVRELARRYRIELPDSATEGECLRLARQSGAAVVGAGFAPLVQAWMALAYARRAPADFEALLALYRRHFEPGAGASS